MFLSDITIVGRLLRLIQAAAHVSGFVAYSLMTQGPCTPAVMKERIRGLAEGNSAVHLTPQAGKPILSSYMCWVISITIVVAVNAGTTTRLAYNGA